MGMQQEIIINKIIILVLGNFCFCKNCLKQVFNFSKSIDMKKDKIFSIITIACFCTIILIPIGLALMWFTTNWKKKPKIIFSCTLFPFYIALVIFLLLLEPSYNTSGIGLPFSYSKGYTAFDSTGGKQAENKSKKDSKSKKNGKDSKFDSEEAQLKAELGIEEPKEERLPKSLKKQNGKKASRSWIPILFFLAIIAFIIIQNLRNRNKKGGYENPYVDTNQYKLPFTEDTKMPMVHFLGLHLNNGERILYATETNQKDNEGNFVVTNQRVLLYSKEGDYEFPLNVLSAISSVSNTVMLLTSGERKYYIFVPENQMKYALAVVRWAYSKAT